jgi:hypothetical protein
MEGNLKDEGQQGIGWRCQEGDYLPATFLY